MMAGPELSLRRSPRASRLRLVVKPSGIELVLPRDFSESEAMNFYARHRDWAVQKHSELLRKKARQDHDLPLIGPEGTWLFLGVENLVRRIESDAFKPRVHYAPATGFVIEVPRGQLVSDDVIKQGLFGELRPRIRQEVSQRLIQLGEPFGLRARSLRIKRMRTRWGSCGPASDINLNWLLAFAAPEVLDYVLFHELCHIRHRNHSPDFWSLVAEGIPDWRQHRRWLRNEGVMLLKRFG